MPNFTPTKDGAELEIGDTAKVETVDFGHKVPVQWEVTVGEPERIDAPRKAKQASEFICFPVTFTPSPWARSTLMSRWHSQSFCLSTTT